MVSASLSLYLLLLEAMLVSETGVPRSFSFPFPHRRSSSFSVCLARVWLFMFKKYFSLWELLDTQP